MKNELGDRLLRVSEIFYSIEGEGPLAGMPTVFVRFFGCNFTCAGFSNPDVIPIIRTGTDDLKKFKPTMGCDSIYAWHPDYKSLTTVYGIEDLAKAILDVLPKHQRKYNGVTHMPVLSLTGGEPTLHQAGIADLLRSPLMGNFSKLLIETNAALDLKPNFIRSLNEWVSTPGRTNTVIWSCSPKLLASGESRVKAIRPSVLTTQLAVPSMQYLKFVSDGSPSSFDEIAQVFEEYSEAMEDQGLSALDPFSIYVMPVGATLEQQMEIQQVVAERCLEYGYNFAARVHCYVFGNAVGT